MTPLTIGIINCILFIVSICICSYIAYNVGLDTKQKAINRYESYISDIELIAQYSSGKCMCEDLRQVVEEWEERKENEEGVDK